MTESKTPYEIEIRCRFDSPVEAYHTLPFLHSCLQREVSWTSRIYGLTLFRLGQLLRIGEVLEQGEIRNYLGWKGPDIGIFANVRLEVDEEITSGIKDSVIMGLLGSGKKYVTPAEVIKELERLGHGEFMSFSGKDLSGYEKQFDLEVKLMMCNELKWPLLVELEKTAGSEEDSRRREIELRNFCDEFQLHERLVKEEPPTLLYGKLFGYESKA